MAGGFCFMKVEEEEESEFYDARDEISSSSESAPSSPSPFQRSIQIPDVLSGFLAGKLDSVEERRRRFMTWMRSNAMFSPRTDLGLPFKEEEAARSGEIVNSGDSSVSDPSRIPNPETEKISTTDLRANSQEIPTIRREDNLSTGSTESTRRRRSKWLRRLGIAACIMDREEDEDPGVSSSSEDASNKNRIRRVEVRLYRKPSKEFSGVFSGQEIRAHKGAIMAMKFSPDGRFLATGGEDGIVRVWSVTSQQRKFEDDLSSSNFENLEKLRSWKIAKRNRDSACVVIPSEVCRISEEPLREFVGHSGEILDLCWSKKNILLSASTDKTARVWEMGSDSAGKVFSHGNYVTCVQFNPQDEGSFISGSIDGKVRIWEISSRHVINWIDVREIVTAACFDPHGKDIVVGTISGRCLFYDSSGQRLELTSTVLLQGKKKPASNRITGFQFCPTDSNKLLVTTSDSQVRILEGHTVVCKFKGIRNSGSQISATFTEDGRYVLSGSEDSHVYIWNMENRHLTRRRNNPAPYEKFPAIGSSIAVSWPSISPPVNLLRLFFSVPGDFSLAQNLFGEFLKGTATWPEEKLPTASPLEGKVLQQSFSAPPHAWGRVIVTGGWDGRLRSFHNYGLPIPA